MATQRSDLAFGLASELNVLEVLQQYLETTLNRLGGYAVFDFESPDKTVMVELKSRRIRHNTYDTAIIGLNKIAFCDKMTDVTFHLAFAYTDGLYTITYDKELFDTFEVRHEYVRGSRSDVTNKPSSVVMIPTKLLTKVVLPPVDVSPLVSESDEKDTEPYFYQ
jgi:hypothetical protein